MPAHTFQLPQCQTLSDPGDRRRRSRRWRHWSLGPPAPRPPSRTSPGCSRWALPRWPMCIVPPHSRHCLCSGVEFAASPCPQRRFAHCTCTSVAYSVMLAAVPTAFDIRTNFASNTGAGAAGCVTLHSGVLLHGVLPHVRRLGPLDQCIINYEHRRWSSCSWRAASWATPTLRASTCLTASPSLTTSAPSRAAA